MDICPVCGRTTIQIKDGKEMYLPCLCVWERGFHERLKRTVGSSYWTKTLSNWNPPLFDRPCSFHDLIRVQKLVVISRLWSFCFKEVTLDEKKVPSLKQSIAHNRNLFIRGPSGSGRGLLTSCVKIFAAMKDISITELPCEFDIFKTEVAESSSYSKSGEDARLVVLRKYIDPLIFVLENIRSENINKNSQFQKKYKAADQIDAIFAKRQSHSGSIIITSQDFLGDIGDYYGDRIVEEMSLDKTMMILLFHPSEIDALRVALVHRQKSFASVLSNYDNNTSKKDKRRIDKQSQAEDMSLIEEGMYFEDAFEHIPVPDEEAASAHSIQSLFSTGNEHLPYERFVIEVYNKFEENKKEQNVVYQKGIQRAMINGVKACKELSSLMTDRECLELGKMIATASKRDKSKLKEIEEKAFDMVLTMSGKKK